MFAKNPELTIHWSSVDGVDLMDPIVISVERGTKLYEALNSIGATYGAYEPFTKTEYQQGWSYFYEKPLNEYIEQGLTIATMHDVSYVSSEAVINEDMDVYVLMNKALGTAPTAAIEAPICGTETETTIQNNEWDWNSQTSRPTVSTDGDHYHLETENGKLCAYWIDDENRDDPFIGTFEGEEAYYAYISLEADLGYYFDKDIEEVTGAEEVVSTYPDGEWISAIVKVKAVHDWGDWIETKAATETAEGEETRYCSYNNEHKETRPIPMIVSCGIDVGPGSIELTALEGYEEDSVYQEITATSTGTEEVTFITAGFKETASYNDFRIIVGGMSAKVLPLAGLKEGVYTATVIIEDFEDRFQPIEIPLTFTVSSKASKYYTSQGNNQLWTKGSNTTADFIFKCSTDDSMTFSHFTGIQVDGKDVAASDYTAEAGSVIVKLKPAYLETLSVGDHTVTAVFDDGNDPVARFTISQKTETTVPFVFPKTGIE